jgi:CYTH domain-containing protein
VWHTTVYLDASEYEVLSALAAWPLVKRRWSLQAGGAVDELLGPLDGLVLLEGDRPFDPPVSHLGEVTDDGRFCGGSLACLDEQGARGLIAEVAGRRP